MTKKHFIALADKIKSNRGYFTDQQISILADFCNEQNAMFKHSRWIDYINGECGKNGGKIK